MLDFSIFVLQKRCSSVKSPEFGRRKKILINRFILNRGRATSVRIIIHKEERWAIISTVYAYTCPIKIPFKGQGEGEKALWWIAPHKVTPKCSWQRISGTKRVLRNVTPRRANISHRTEDVPGRKAVTSGIYYGRSLFSPPLPLSLSHSLCIWHIKSTVTWKWQERLALSLPLSRFPLCFNSRRVDDVII